MKRTNLLKTSLALFLLSTLISGVVWWIIDPPILPAQSLVNIGTSANDGTGDSIRTAFGKINANATNFGFYHNPNQFSISTVTNVSFGPNAVVTNVLFNLGSRYQPSSTFSGQTNYGWFANSSGLTITTGTNILELSTNYLLTTIANNDGVSISTHQDTGRLIKWTLAIPSIVMQFDTNGLSLKPPIGNALFSVNTNGVVFTTNVMYSAANTVGDFYIATGSPEGVITAGIGSTCRRGDGGAGTSFYVKQATGSTGWAAK